MQKAVVLACVCGPFTLAPAVPCHAESITLGDVATDAKLYFTAPLRWDAADWMYFGGTIAVVAASHAFDTDVRRHFAARGSAALNGADPNSIRDAIPAAATFAATWLYANLSDDSAGRVEAYTMLEAAGFSTITAEALKYAAGRERPDQTTDENAWRSGGSSFPSLHSTAAFAIGTVLAESGGDDFRWVRRFLGYGMAGATTYLRLHGNQHWLSDTVAGAAVGVATARFTMNRREVRAHAWQVSVQPAQGGGVALLVHRDLP
ncbi:MAG TPA: phosphatase PAP2 family protein [Steroidobacteraceae bacterium]